MRVGWLCRRGFVSTRILPHTLRRALHRKHRSTATPRYDYFCGYRAKAAGAGRAATISSHNENGSAHR